jgi:hypothetical protein
MLMGAIEQIFIDLFFTPAGSIIGLTLFLILMISLTVVRKEFTFVSIIMSVLLMTMYFDYWQTYPVFVWNFIILLLFCFFNGIYMVTSMRRR